MTKFGLAQSIARVEDPRLLKGVGRYTYDIVLPGMLHGIVLRSPHATAKPGERTNYDADGQLLSGSFMDYALPRADDLPDIEVDLLEVPTASNPLGVKGAGEAGSVGSPPALVNAIIDALAGDGVTHIDMPATPDNVWQALATAKAA